MAGIDPQTFVLATLGASLILFVTDALRYDAVAILVVLALAITGCLSPQEAYAGFASPAIVLVASMYVFAAAIARAGVTEIVGRRILGTGTPTETGLVLRVTLVAGLLSSVLSNAAVVATLIPVLGSVSRTARVPASRLLMPLAFGSLLGGMLTVIGTSKNIAVNGVIEQQGSQPFGLFDFTLYGLVLLVVGALWLALAGRHLMPRGRVEQSLTEYYQVPKYVTEVLVEPNSTLINRSVADSDLFERYGIALLGLVRAQGEATVLAPGPYNRIRSDDVLILQGEPDAIVRFRQELDLKERRSAAVGDTRLASADVQLVEAVVPSTSDLVGRTLAESDFRATSGLNVLAISKHGDVQPTQIADARLEVGDTLLLQGHARDMRRIGGSRRLIVLGELQTPGFGRNAAVTLGLLGAMLLFAATGWLPLSIAALAAALGLVLTGCVRPDDVRRSVDWSVLILIGGMLALGKAFAKHGLDQRLSEWVLGLGGALAHPMLVVALLLLVTLVLTQLVNHVAAAVIMAPVAISLAASLGWDDRAFLMAVLTGAEFAFMSPVAHQANAMIMGPGDYRYRDFLRAGAPFTVLLAAVACALLPVFWPVEV
jgi:di/tricarboxylate transporter